MVEKMIAGKHFPRGGRRKFDGEIYHLKSVHRTKTGAKKEKDKYKKAGKFVRILKCSGGFPYHIFVR